jgi:hypothetical protein
MARFRLELPNTTEQWIAEAVLVVLAPFWLASTIGIVTAPMILLVWLVIA